ncbi:His Kinase A (phospho-acceptor) domain-containing protein [Belliella buryatensis]|uniref:histidine kinase n=1 Tax=Belliella buryatensis TaxID=1500549 RepID=A0A239ET80_9BACT|nr:HAMP domain-containing sensor histidine kinase [Belliella buryatensis]SNS47799.1 His Kinase A (phospho-acceptor) domain-containing protein [Belliella buryatensis]
MTSSILVMLVLQGLWLHAVYQDYKSGLKQETSLLFSNTVTDLIDSLVWKGASPLRLPPILPVDSISASEARGVVLRRIDQQFHNQLTDGKLKIQVTVDSLKDTLGDSVRNRVISIVSSDSNFGVDSIRQFIRPIIQKTDSISGRGMEFIFRREILDSALVSEVFNKRLTEQDYNLSAAVRRLNFGQNISTDSTNRLVLDEVIVPFGVKLQAELINYQPYLWSKMFPTLLFGILALALISFSFLVLYKNILNQQRLNLLKNDLISNITHELKTPVATVGIVLEALENFGVDQQVENRKEYIQIAKKELNRLSQMSESILSSLVSGMQKESKIEIRFDQILEEQIHAFKPILQAKGFIFNFEKQAGKYNLFGIQEQLTLMIFNLLDNAVKYSIKTKLIHLKLYKKEKQLVFEIQDQGIGIPEKYQKDIFDKFVRVPQADLHDVKGYGLGLSQVAAAVQTHQGKISLNSKEGKGTIFTITLPTND